MGIEETESIAGLRVTAILTAKLSLLWAIDNLAAGHF